MIFRGKIAFALVVAGSVGLGGAAASCSSGDDSTTAPDDDASTVVHHDAGGPPPDTDAAGICAPDLPAGYSSTYSPPLTTNTACTSDQVQQFYTQCFDPAATSTACNAFVNANKSCVNCMYTAQGSSAYGAVISLDNGTAEANISGCLALVDGDNSATSCAAKYQAGQFCEIDACNGCTIDSTDNTTFTAFTKCETNAGTSVCAGYESDGGCEKDPKYAACNKPTTFEQYMITLGNLICASGNVSDAGSDAGDAGITDASDDASDSSDDASDAADD